MADGMRVYGRSAFLFVVSKVYQIIELVGRIEVGNDSVGFGIVHLI